MRVFVGVLLVVLSVSLAAAAADLKVKVVDPQGASVAGAQVSLLRAGEGKVLAKQGTSAEGSAILHLPDGGCYQI
jgi:hypothetical protein